MTSYGTIPTLSSSEGTNEFISTPQLRVYGRPWKEMLRSLNLPSGFRNTIDRMKTNLIYFRANYIIILMLVLFLSFLFHPVSLSVFLLLLMDVLLVLHISNSPGVICLLTFSLISLLFTEAAWNIIISLSIEAVFVIAHASLRKTDDLSLDEQQLAGIGYVRGRPWKDMLRSLNLPSGFLNTIERIKTNLNYFKINYAIILMLILFLSFFCHPVSLTLIFTLYILVWLFVYYLQPPVFHQSSRKVFVIVLVIISVILLSFTEAAWINVISTMVIEAVVVVAHASVRNTDDLFMDEELTETAGVLTSSPS